MEGIGSCANQCVANGECKLSGRGVTEMRASSRGYWSRRSGLLARLSWLGGSG